MYRELLVPVDNSAHSDWSVDRGIELCTRFRGRLTASHVYAARLHDVRFRQLETGLPARFQTPDEIKRQRKIHDKLIEKGLQLISDSFLEQVAGRCREAEVPMTRQLLEGINYEELTKEANRGEGQLPSLIGFDPNIARSYDGGEVRRADVRLDGRGRIVAEEETEAKTAGSTNRVYDLVVLGAHGIGRQEASQLGGVSSRVLRGLRRDALVVKDERPLEAGRYLVCVDGSSYGYRAMRRALELARAFGSEIFLCSAFDVEYHHVVFNNIKDVLSVQASKVFKFEEQEELHNNIIDKGLLKLCQANIKRAEAMASEFPDVRVTSQILIGKPFQVVLRWAAEIDPTLLVLARHGAHRIDGTEIGSQADNVLRLVPCNVLLVGTEGVSPEDIPWIEEDGEEGLEWAPEAEVRILRVPPFALGIARRAVEEYVLEHADFQPPERPIVTNAWLDEAIRKLLPTHMQLIMGIGDAEELARAEVKAEEAMRRTVVMTSDADEIGVPLPVEARCPYTGQVTLRDRTAEDPPVWTVEAFARLGQVPLIARPLARNTVERFAGRAGVWRITRRVMDENRQSMIEADEFDLDTMLVMFNELKVRQATAETAGADGLSEEMRRFIEEAKASGVTRCPIRDIEDMAGRCPVDLTLATPESAKEAVERALEDGDPSHAADEAVGRDT